MEENEEKLTIRRILVALDASHHSLAALEAAVELASSLEAELLEGIFVEDVKLLRVAGLPGAREVCYPFTGTAQLNPARMKRQLRAQAVQARQALAAACNRKQIKWAFRVVRGDVASEVLEAATEADLLSLGRASRPLIQRPQTGSTARAVVMQTSRSVLLLPRDARLKPPIVVPYNGSPAVEPALRLAAHLAQEKNSYLSVLIMAEAAQAIDQLRTQISEWLEGYELIIRYRQLVGDGVRTLIEAIQTEGSGTLILSDAILDPDDVQMLLDKIDCPVLLVRQA